jgi:fumarate reductase flavoprotein subunit
MTADVVVCGTGFSGMVAAVRAAELGAKVIVLEKMSEEGLGGSSRLAGVIFAVREEGGGTAREDEVFALSVEYHRHACNEKVLRTFLRNSGSTLDWLVSQGVEIEDSPIPGTEAYLYKKKGGSDFERGGASGIRSLYARGREYGVQFLFETPVKELVMKDGKVSGVLATNAKKETIAINAPVVIVATGGFGSNKDFFEKYTQWNYGNLRDNGLAGRDGDGLNMGLSAGAALHLPSAVNFCNPTMRGEIEESLPHTITCLQQPCVWVNSKAARFVNEDTVRDWTKNGNAVGLESKTFSVIDTAFLESIKTKGTWNGATGLPVKEVIPGTPIPNVYEMTEMDKKLNEKDPVAWKADTIEELATKMGLDPKALAATIKSYNDACAAGVDPLGKPAQYLLPVSKPPYYGFRMLLAFFNTCGGLKVDKQMGVVAKTGDAIPGLYAAGCDAGAAFGYYYDYSIAPGAMQGWCSTSGRLAGEAAVKFVKG